MFIETSLKQLYKNHSFEKSEKYECDYELKNASNAKINECLENEIDGYIDALSYEFYESDSLEISIKFLDENNNILGQKTVKKG